MKLFILSNLLVVVLVMRTTAGETTRSSDFLPAMTPLTVLKVWPAGKMPGHGAPKAEREWLSKDDNILRAADVSDPTITVYQTRETTTFRPAVIVCPGGAYRLLSMNLEGTEIASWLNSLGATAIVLKYRVPDNRTGALQDVERAVRLVRANEKLWHLDDSRIGVMGFSAGGHLCAHLSATCENPAYAPIDDVDELSCRPDFVALVYPAYLGKKEKVAPELPVTSHVPPTFVVQTEDDKFLSGTKLYAAALIANDVPCEFHFYRTGGHGYGLRSHTDARIWPEAAEKWFNNSGILSTNAPAVAKPPADKSHFYSELRKEDG